MFRKQNGKTGVTLKIAGFGDRHIKTLLADYDGTLSCQGEVTEQIKERLARLAERIDIHILTADRKAKSNGCFGRLPVTIKILSGDDQDVQKRECLRGLVPANVAVFGNGNNDRLLLEAVKSNGGLCVAISNGEGCAAPLRLESFPEQFRTGGSA